MARRHIQSRGSRRNDEDRDLIPLLDVFSNALGAAAFLFVVFPSLSIDATRTAINPDPSTTTTVGQKAVWMVRVTPSAKCALNNPGGIRVSESLRPPDELIDKTAQHVMILLRTADEAPNFSIETLKQNGSGCGSILFTLFASTGRHQLEVEQRGDDYDINVRRVVKVPQKP